jgi:O-antigen ligase
MKIDLGSPLKSKLDLTMWWGIVALLGLLIFSTAAGQTLLILLILLGLFRIIRMKNISIIKNPITITFIVFIGMRILSIIFSEFPDLSVHSLNKEIFFYLIFFVFLFELSQYDEKKIRFLFQILIIAAILASLVGISKVFFGISERAKSTTSGYSTLGMFLSVIFAMVFALGKNKEFFPSRISWIIALLIIASGILFTFNRSNWISVTLVILIIGLYRERNVLGSFIIIFALVIFLIPSLTDRFGQIIHFAEHLSDRDVLWRGALMIWDQHPILGFGTKSFNEIFLLPNQLVDKGVGGWHNEYLQIYLESGLLGLMAFWGLSFSIFWGGLKTLRSYRCEKRNFELMLVILASMTTFYLNTITGGFMFDPIVKVIFFFLLALECVLIDSQMNKAVLAKK